MIRFEIYGKERLGQEAESKGGGGHFAILRNILQQKKRKDAWAAKEVTETWSKGYGKQENQLPPPTHGAYWKIR